ncbi:MAG TPA: hypothetical protein VGM05_09405 [Planctomycetaceae bacterium]
MSEPLHVIAVDVAVSQPEAKMQELELLVPTFCADNPRDDSKTGEGCGSETTGLGCADGAIAIDNPQSDFGAPFVPVLVHEADGVRVVLGTHQRQSADFSDIQIERRGNGWAIFLHPVGGCDPSAVVYYLDDGRSFVSPVPFLGPTPAIEFLGRNDEPRDLRGSG